MLTWFAVSTGLPTLASSASSTSTVCSAVSGSSTASAPGASEATAAAKSSTVSGGSVPTSAAVMMSRADNVCTEMSWWVRKCTKAPATSGG